MITLTPYPYRLAPDRKAIKALYSSAFPKHEQMPWWLLRLLTAQKDVQLTGYDSGERFCGFTYTAATEELLFVLFFAVEPAVRGEGYGSAILRLLKAQHPGKTVLLNVELLDPDAPNYDQRVRRFRFYERNGFYDTGLDIDEVGGTFRVLATRPEIDARAYGGVFRKMSMGLWTPKIRKSETGT